MIFVDEMKDLRIYTKPFHLPINEKNKKKGSAVYLLTPNHESSMNLLKSPLLINNNGSYKSYYMEKNVNYYFMNEGYFTVDNRDEKYIHGIEEKYIEEATMTSSKLYFLSTDNHNGETLNPRVPTNFLTNGGYEESTTPRVCFSTSIDGSLIGLSQNLKGKSFYVHQPVDEVEYYIPTKSEVPDAKITHEVWVKNPVKIKTIGKISVSEADKDYNYTYGNNTATTCSWKWKWVDRHLNEASSRTIYPNKDFVSAVIRNEQNRYLIIFSNSLNRFTFPFGEVNEGEEDYQAIKRIMKDKYNLQITDYRPAFSVENLIPYKGNKQVYATENVFRVYNYDGYLKNLDTRDCKGYKWLSFKEITELPNDTKSVSISKFETLIKSGGLPDNVVRPTLLEYKTHNFFYYGYKADVDAIKKILNERFLKYTFHDLDYNINPNIRINVNVIDDISKYRKCTPDTMWVYSKSLYNYEFSGDYDNYLKTELYTFILNKYNNNISPELLSGFASYASGEYLEVVKDPVYDTKVSSIYKIMEYIDTKYGRKELLNIVKKNDIRKFCKYGVETSMNDFNSLIGMFESSLNETKTLKAGKDYAINMDQLVRRNKMRSRRGSQYKINHLNKWIQQTVDPNVPMPEIKDKDGNILNPTSAPKLQKPGATSAPDPATGSVNNIGDGQAGIDVATSDTNGPAPDEKTTEESYSFDEYYTESDYLLKTDNLIMISEEAFEKNNILKRLLYQDRLKRNKEVMNIYVSVKAQNEKIKFTYHNLDRYKQDNLFIDLYYYNEVFFRNSNYQKQRGLELYSQMMSRLLGEDRYTKAGYTKKTVFIPVQDWDINPETNMWIYREDINPVSIITEGIKNQPYLVKNIFNNMDVVFFGRDRYFKINFGNYEDSKLKTQYTLFLRLIKTLCNDTKNFITPEEDDNDESKKAIVANITDKLEKSQGIKIMSLGVTGEKKVKDLAVDNKSEEDKAKDTVTDKKKEELMDAINKVAETSKNTDEALDRLDDERIKQLIIDLASEEEGIKINQARSSRMMKLQDDFVDKEVKGVKVKDMLSESKETLPEKKLKVGSINKEWESVKAINFNAAYDLDSDIIRILHGMNKWSNPVAIRDINVEDTSTTEDYIYTYTVNCEDSKGTRFTLKFDIPKLIDQNYMVLRGNKKQLNIQAYLMPIFKHENYECQIISNYNKIFIRRSSLLPGKTNETVDKLLKALNKYDGDKITLIAGDNELICNRSELPIDYIDLARVYSTIETPNYIFYLNQREIREKYNVDESKGVPYYVDKKRKEVNYFYDAKLPLTRYITDLLCVEDPKFREIYESVKPGVKHCYSVASVLGNKIPLIVVMAYSEGLTASMKKANIKYEFKENLTNGEKHSVGFSYIKFKDGFIYYESDYASDLLMNGLKECDTESHSINEINKKSLYLEFLENFGGRLLGDGLDAFYDCMIDHITEETLKHYHLPTDYIEVLAHANSLLVDNKYISHSDYTTSKRFRKEELVAANFYRCLCTSYESYSQQLKHTRTNAKMTMKQSAVIDAIMAEPILSDKSFCNALSDVEDKNTVSAKGHSGMNAERAYNLDKREYDSSMLGILTMGTGFSGNVGINRQASIDFTVDGARGYVHTVNDKEDLNTANTLCMTEAVTPFGSTHDDAVRTAMTFIQTSKHSVTTYGSDPSLITNGADEALAYYTSNIFAFKAEEAGKVIEMNDKFMIIEYKGGKKDMVQLGTIIEKNSNGGYSVAFEIVTDLKVGSTFKADDILAHEKSSFTKEFGETNNLVYNIGKLTKIAILNTEEGYEDSAAVTQDLCDKLTTRITIPRNVTIPKTTNVYNVLKKGTPVEEGDTLMIMQAPSDEEDVNMLLKNLAGDEEDITELGRIPIHSHYTGIIKDVKIYRTCEVDDEMSESLRKLVKSYESDLNKYKSILKKNGITDSTLPPTTKVEPIGRFKHAEDSIVIEFDIEYEDVFGIGDKLVYYSGNKGVNKYIIPEGEEPTSTFRPDEKIGAFVSIGSLNGRMITSTILTAGLNKLMVELDRTCKDMAGIKYDVNDI